VIDATRAMLRLPETYVCAIVPASDTGAMEMAMWSLLGPRGVDVLAWEAFGKEWVTDIVKQLPLDDVRAMEADYGHLPNLADVDWTRDVVFTWNGTTSGVRVPDADWIPADREGLAICDATSAVFAQEMDFTKLDVVTFSWQKVMGGEAQHGMLILSPRAVARLESHTPAWPMPKLFRMTKDGKLDAELFAGATVNTPSMLCVEDYADALRWADSVGGYDGLRARADANATAIAGWVAKTDWIDFLCVDPAHRSNTSVCLKIADPDIAGGSAEAQAEFAKKMVAALEKEGVAYDIGSYRDAPPGLRIWCGATVETSDIEALTLWLEWAFAATKQALPRAA
jgi:phosphoserine aminotransferase